MYRLLWIAVLVGVSGCHRSGGLSRVEVRGNVTYEGSPVKHGMIVFRPANKSKGPSGGTAIVDGKFLLPADKGPIPGPHLVELKLVDAPEESATIKEPAQALQRAAQLRSFSQQVEVKSGPNEFEFSFPANSPASANSSTK